MTDTNRTSKTVTIDTEKLLRIADELARRGKTDSAQSIRDTVAQVGRITPVEVQPAPSNPVTKQVEEGIRLRHAAVEQSGDKLSAARSMAYLSHLDRGELLAEIERLRNALSQSIETVKRLMPESLPVETTDRIRVGLETIREYTGPNGHPNGRWDAHVIATRLLEGKDQNGRLPPAGQSPEEPSPVQCAYTYDVVAYNESWGGYGDNASREGFKTAEEAITYAKSCAAHLNAMAFKRTIPIPVKRVSVQIYPPENGSRDAKI